MEEKDAVDPQGVMQQSIMFRRGLQQEALEEIDLHLDVIDPSEVVEYYKNNKEMIVIDWSSEQGLLLLKNNSEPDYLTMLMFLAF